MQHTMASLLLLQTTINAYVIPGRLGHRHPEISVPDCHNTYLVQPNDTCSDILTSFAMSSNVFSHMNPLVNCNNNSVLIPNTLVCVTGLVTDTMQEPSFNGTLSTSTSNNTDSEPEIVCTSSYTFQNSENCTVVAALFGLDSETVAILNPSLPCNSHDAPTAGYSFCLAGMNQTNRALVLGVSQHAAGGFATGNCSVAGSATTVTDSSTCFGVAEEVGVSLTMLAAANPGLDCRNLTVGSMLCLKMGSASVATDATRSNSTATLSSTKNTTTTTASAAMTTSVTSTSTISPTPEIATTTAAAQAESPIQNENPPGDSSPDLVSDCLSELNYARGHYTGAPPLSWDASLAGSCQPVADACGATNSLVHFDVNGGVGGQILAGTRSCSGAYSMWVTEEYPYGGHYQIITSEAFSRVGCTLAAVGSCLCCDFS
ncbi:hypothetical protein BC830DRAFT_1136144 [Chytriomyces sp. MP71]|nr:hypothetical protein BC830DRAFT_1136144 [Chytriomyces sp. MP71]